MVGLAIVDFDPSHFREDDTHLDLDTVMIIKGIVRLLTTCIFALKSDLDIFRLKVRENS